MKCERVNPPSLRVWEMPVKLKDLVMDNILHENIHATRVSTLFAEELGPHLKIT